ncbi:MAG: nitrogen regulation protein NR(I) [Gammaproteobacteria bacterium]|nr:nitrogen regulation protein NR(I) [Gammaproteobacteria bacterium]
MKNNTIWIVDDDQSIRWVLERAFKQASLITRSFVDGAEVLDALAKEQPDAIITDVRMPGIDGLELMQKLSQQCPDIPIIIMTAHSDLDSAVSAYQGGAFEYLAKPFDIDDAISIVQRACKTKLAAAAAQENTPENAQQNIANEIIGAAPAMQEVFRAIGRLSRSSVTVLINGESGTGKELIATALHKHSLRAGKPFIAINTAAIPKDLLESELFGHERGAFTGAHSQHAGRFEQANGGTLFLDEIGDMPAQLQTRLLRVLAEGEFYRIGGKSSIKVDVRIITATHQNLEELVSQGEFREDLFHRLNVIRIHTPSLRERREDIPLLLSHFLSIAASELGEQSKQPLPEVIKYLSSLDWPGNVRQLENTCRWLTVMGSGNEIHMDDLPPEIKQQTAADNATGNWETQLKTWAEQQLLSGNQPLLASALPMFERIVLAAALKHSGGHKQEAAKILGWGRNTVTRKIKELGLK